MLKKILIGLLAFILILTVVVAMQPAAFRYERSAIIAAPANVLFAQVNDPRKFEAWNPWMALDPQVQNTYSGPAEGVGAACTWSGNNEIGEGTSTITESTPGELVRMKMEFRRPMESVSTSDFTFQPEGEGTRVTWSMYGANNFAGKAFGLFIDCDKMIGTQFEKGLASLAGVVKSPPQS